MFVCRFMKVRMKVLCMFFVWPILLRSSSGKEGETPSENGETQGVFV